MSTWRVIDTGVRSAAENLALNRALLEARAQGEMPNTLRFLRFHPSALLGYHQAAEQELDIEYCRRHGIAIQRRITGGGAIYFDAGQLGWELYLGRAQVRGLDMQGVTRKICEAAARAISCLGVDARFRPRNDIEVDGRKISGSGGAFDGEALMYQGTLLVEFDIERMLRVLRIPAQKLAGKAFASARERVTDLRTLLGAAPPLDTIKQSIAAAFAADFDVTLVAGELTSAEQGRWAQALREMDHPDWVHLVTSPRSELPILEASQKFAGGSLRVALTLDRLQQCMRQVWFSGDMFVSPRRTIADLEASLRDAPLHTWEDGVRAFFGARSVDMQTLTAEDFIVVTRAALSRDRQSAAIGK